jgi:HSP20 family molecular chaperone IbpA
MYIIDYNKLFDTFFDEPLPKWKSSYTTSGTASTTNFSTPAKCAVELKEDKLELAFSIVGHNPKDVEVQLTADKIFIKAIKNKEDKSVIGQFTADINEEIKITDEFDGLTAKAEIKNGLLHIVVDKKEDQKPKKLEIKFK